MKTHYSCLPLASAFRFAHASRRLSTLLICLSAPAFGQTINQAPPPETKYAVTERGQHYRIMGTVTWMTNATGRTFARTNSYTELATGMHHLVDGQWRESTDEIITVPGGAAATNASHQVAFSANAETPEAIRLTMPDRKTLSSHVIGISYLDVATGSNAMVAELNGSVGQLLSSGEVLYTNALQGDFVGDILCKFSKAGMEQSVIIRTKPAASPAEYGLDPATTMLQLWTEFINPPSPIIRSVPQRKVTTGAGTILTDIELNFGTMTIGVGKAFSIGDGASADSVRVIKEWVTLQNRTFLVEQVPLSAVAAELRTLPAAGTTGTNAPRHASLRRATPPPFTPRSLQAKSASQPNQLARANSGLGRGFLMDYSIMTSQTNLVLQSDTTYYITGPINLSGTTTIEGGTVVKYGNSGTIQINGPVNCVTDRYRPAVFSSKDDNSVGSLISGSTGNPWTNYAGGTALYLLNYGCATELKYIRLSYLNNVFEFDNGPVTNTLNHSQLVGCGGGINFHGCDLRTRNVLMTQIKNWCFTTEDSPVIAEHLTVNNCPLLFSAQSPDSPMFLTNSLLVAVTSLGPTNCAGANYQWFTNDPGIFQTVGAASYYLADGSPYRNSGTTNINPTLLSQLRQKTTYPPNILYVPGVYVSNSISLSAIVPRDNGSSLALGYHYEPIDWAVSYLYVTNSTVTVNPGTVITTFSSPSAYGFSTAGGLAINVGAQLLANGTPLSPVRFVENSTVQEHSNTNWVTKPSAFILPSISAGTPWSVVNCRFTDFSSLAQDCTHLGYGEGGASPVNLQDCQLHGGTIDLEYHPINLTNCLLERVASTLVWDDTTRNFIRNNLFYGGSLDFYPGATNAIVKDNVFDHTAILEDLTGWGYDGGHNAYVTNCDRMLPAFTNDIVLAGSIAFEIGPLGNYYQPTNSPLINAGSTTADLVGLYHYTVTTNLVSGAEVKEGTSVIDVGLHYVAVDASGNFIDTDGDGLPDYFEDINGNGVYDSATDLSNWTAADTDGDGVNDYWEYIWGRSPKVAGSAPDTNGVVHLQVYTPLK